jgi:integrase
MTTQDIGGIYSDQRCPLCGGPYIDDKQSALRCPSHPQHIAGQFKVKIRGTTSRYNSYTDASLCLKAKRQDLGTGVSLKKRNLGEIQDTFLDWKQDLVNMGRLDQQTIATYRNRLNRIVHVIGVSHDASSIRYKHVHGFLYKAGFAPKSTYDSYTIFKEMIEWAFDMGEITAKPKWPPFDFSLEHDMKRRKTVDKETQERVLHDIFLHEWEERPRLYLAVKFLATYINIRPAELLGVREKDYVRDKRRLDHGTLFIKNHKSSRRPKIIKLLPEDVSLLNDLPRGMPYLPLFRYENPANGVNRSGLRFGQAAFYRAWKRACTRLGIEGVDLYGGTRHSSAIALYKEAGVSPEEIKKATGHKTSIALRHLSCVYCM